jgi:hypothetical protein
MLMKNHSMANSSTNAATKENCPKVSAFDLQMHPRAIDANFEFHVSRRARVQTDGCVSKVGRTR